MDEGVWGGLLGSKEVFSELTDIIMPRSRGGFIYVSCIIRARSEFSIIEESGRNIEANLLHQ